METITSSYIGVIVGDDGAQNVDASETLTPLRFKPGSSAIIWAAVCFLGHPPPPSPA